MICCIRVKSIPHFLTFKKVLYLQALKVCISGTSMEQAEIISFLNNNKILVKTKNIWNSRILDLFGKFFQAAVSDSENWLLKFCFKLVLQAFCTYRENNTESLGIINFFYFRGQNSHVGNRPDQVSETALRNISLAEPMLAQEPELFVQCFDLAHIF